MLQRTNILILGACLLLLCIACDNPIEAPVITPCGCDEFTEIDEGYIPPNRYHDARLSSDGNTLAYLSTSVHESLFLLDLQSGKQQELTFQLPKGFRVFSILEFHWCPYDNSLLLINAVTEVDFDDEPGVYSQNAYIVNTLGDAIRTVTPSQQWFGAPVNSFQISGWLPGSTPELDSLVVSGYGIYLPQKELYVSQFWKYELLERSRAGELQIGTYSDPFQIVLDGKELKIASFPESWIGDASFSPDNRYLVLDGEGGYEKPCSRKIWLVDLEEWSQDVNQIIHPNELKPRELFCLNHVDYGTVFLTDSTIAISMFKEGELYSHYYEISIHGEMIRQISQP